MTLDWLACIVGAILAVRTGAGVLLLQVEPFAPTSGIGFMAIGSTFQVA